MFVIKQICFPMDGSDSEAGGFSMFSKKARITKKTVEKDKGTEDVVKAKAPKEIIKQEDDRLTFKDLGLNDWVVKCCHSMHIVKPTPVQVCFCECVI